MVIETASPDSFDELLAVQTESILGLTTTYGPEELQKWADYIKGEKARRYSDFENALVRDSNGQVEAFVSWKSDGPQASIECLYVRQPFQGRGVGELLLRHAEGNLEGKTVKVRSTLNAKPFYESHGYKFIGPTTSRAGLTIAEHEKKL